MKLYHFLVLGFVALSLISLMLLLMSEKIRNRIISKLRNYRDGIWITPVFIWTLYIVLSIVDWGWDSITFLKLILYFSVPTFILDYARWKEKPLGIPDIIAMLFLWLPFDLRLMDGSWPVLGEFRYHTSATMAVIYTFITFCGFRRIDINASWRLSKKDILSIAGFLSVLSAILIPLGSSLNFLGFGLSDLFFKAVWMVPVYLVTIFISTALPEELLFRGIIQNVLTKRFSFVLALFLTSIIFGFAHINNNVRFEGYLFQPPNWTYVMMATIAGFFYGGIFYKQRSLLTAMILHTLVDFTWVMFLRG